MTDFYTLADQLHAELGALFERWPELHPDNRKSALEKALLEMGRTADAFLVALGIKLLPVMERTIESFKELWSEIIEWRRGYLYESLPRWIPDTVAEFISKHCPERWLPEIK